MSLLNEKLNRARADLSQSWYFRIWLLSGVTCVALTLAALILFSDYNKAPDPEGDQAFSVHNATFFWFPVFQFRFGTDPLGSKLDDVICYHNGKELSTRKCSEEQDLNNCQEVAIGGEIAINEWDQPTAGRQIACLVLVEWDESQVIPTLQWELDEYYQKHLYGPNELRVIPLNPNDGISIRLTSSQKLYNGAVEFDTWSPQLTYYGDSSTGNRSYTVTTEIATFRVLRTNVIPQDNIVDWQNCAFVGGFGLFMYILHWLFMAAVGLVFENNSLYLNSDNAAYGANVNSGKSTHEEVH